MFSSTLLPAAHFKPSRPLPPAKQLDIAPPLIPLSLSRRDTVFPDLDETLVHSQLLSASEWFDFVVQPMIDGEPMEPSDDAGSAYEHEGVKIYGYVDSSISKFGLRGLTEAFKTRNLEENSQEDPRGSQGTSWTSQFFNPGELLDEEFHDEGEGML
ncbi:hypothetical protein Fmac_018262 [Flemingia macrophylla]|uniref:Uncharacterized protein n=1 Tax=Flemingia macrophylla TaxID=520843 RepID=A0ABD1M4J8_9FABA